MGCNAPKPKLPAKHLEETPQAIETQNRVKEVSTNAILATIGGRPASLLELPTLESKKQIIACPEVKDQDDIVKFWKELVLDQKVGFIANLNATLNGEAEISATSSKFQFGSIMEVLNSDLVFNVKHQQDKIKFWPTDRNPIFMSLDGTIVVKMEENANEDSSIMKLLTVMEMAEDKQTIIRSQKVAFGIFEEWGQDEIPQTDEQREAFTQMMDDMLDFFIKSDRPEQKMKSNCNKMLVSCKDGRVRTGTVALILTRLLQRHYKTRERQSLKDTLSDLRWQRGGIVSTAKQFEFIEKYDTTGQARRMSYKKQVPATPSTRHTVGGSYL